MESYEDGKAKYYTTLPTDSLMAWSNVLSETRDFGFDLSKSRIFELGGKIRKVLEENGFSSVADDSCKAPGVVVSYSPYEGMYVVFERLYVSCFNNVTQITEIALISLTYITRRSLEYQRLNAHSNVTKTYLALRARTQVRQVQGTGSSSCWWCAFQVG